MPVRIADIPNLQSTPLNRPQADPRAASAPGRALGEVAEGIARLGGIWGDVAEQAQKDENAVSIYDTRSTWRRGWADLQVELDKDPDPASRLRRTDEFLGTLRGTVETPDLAPDVRTQLLGDLNQFADNIYLNSRADAARLTQQRASLAAQEALTTATSLPELKAAHDTAVAAGVGLPESWPKIEREFVEKQQYEQEFTQATTEPAAFLESHPETPPEGADPNKYFSLRNHALGALAQETGEVANSILDGIYSTPQSITKEEQIDDLGASIRPTARQRLKDALNAKANQERQARSQDPAVQAATIGKVQAMLLDYKVSDNRYDEAYVVMAESIRSLPPSAARTELQRALDGSRTGQEKEIKTKADAVRAELDEKFKAGAFGTGNKSTTVPALLWSGLLSRTDQLEARGYTPEQAKIIAAEEVKAEDLEAIGFSALEAKRGAGKGLQARLNRYRTLSKQPRLLDDKSEPWFRGAYDTIDNVGKAGAPKTYDIPDGKLMEERDTHFGWAKRKLEAWLTIHPDPDDAKVREKINELTAPTAKGAFVSQFATPAPSLIEIPGPDEADGSLLPPYPGEE